MTSGDDEPNTELPAGERLGSYEIVRCVGRGGMGEVYEAFHTGLQKRVALKTLNHALAQKQEARARFLREGRAASLIRHPNIVDITDIGEDSGVPFLIMELLEGETLSSVIHRTGPLTVEAAVDVLLPVIDAVASAHDKGVIHRDLKPENIFLSHSHLGGVVPKVLDFGISKLLTGEHDPNLTRTASFMGTPFYMAPEQAQGAKHSDARSDQYSMAVVLYEALTARQPHAGSADSFIQLIHAIAQGNFAAPRSVRHDLPVALEAVVLRAMAVAPDERYASLREFGAALLPFAGGAARSTWGAALRAPASPAGAPAPSAGSQYPSLAVSRPPGLPTTPAPSTATLVTPGASDGQKKARTLLAAGGGLLVVAAAAALLVLKRGDDARPTNGQGVVSLQPALSSEAPPQQRDRTPPPAPVKLDAPPAGSPAVPSSAPPRKPPARARAKSPGVAAPRPPSGHRTDNIDPWER